MRNLILPEGMASVTVFDQSFGENGVIRDVEDHVAAAILAHDPAIREFAPGGPEDPDVERSANAKRAAFVGKIGGMDRKQLFETSRGLKASFPANTQTEVMRSRLIEMALDMDEKDVPVVLSSTSATAAEDGSIVLRSADPNNGNDSAGRAGAFLTGGTDLTNRTGGGGATFSQPTAPAADPAAQPAPPGLGQVGPTGTTQPPYNQLGTEDGKPTNDSGAAPYPISVPPIDPKTGAPYREGDDRIPTTAQPVVHQPVPQVEGDRPVPTQPIGGEDPDGRPTAIPGSPGAQGQGAIKAGNPDPVSAAMATGDQETIDAALESERIEKTAAEAQVLAAEADALPANPDAPIEDDAERLRREERARQAELTADPAAAGADPNHGNDGEGQKDKTEGLKN